MHTPVETVTQTIEDVVSPTTPTTPADPPATTPSNPISTLPVLGQVMPPAVDIVAPVLDTTTVLPSDDPTGSSPSDESLPVLDQVVTPLVTDVTDLGTGLIDPLSAPSEGPRTVRSAS